MWHSSYRRSYTYGLTHRCVMYTHIHPPTHLPPLHTHTQTHRNRPGILNFLLPGELTYDCLPRAPKAYMGLKWWSCWLSPRRLSSLSVEALWTHQNRRICAVRQFFYNQPSDRSTCSSLYVCVPEIPKATPSQSQCRLKFTQKSFSGLLIINYQYC